MVDGSPPSAENIRPIRTLFISDVHLGTRDCRADLLLELLTSFRFESIYLVGDIVDGWRLKVRWYWPPSHDAIVRRLLHLQQAGTRILYIPGNHDEFLRSSLGLHLGGIAIVDHAIHHGVDGRRYLVVHGHEFDEVVARMRRLSALGIWVYAAAVLANDAFIRWRRRLGHSARVPGRRISGFERMAVAEARRRNTSGVICGHVHHAASRDVAGVHYVNMGDWVNSCTAVMECPDGSFELLRWPGALQHPAAPERQGVGVLAPMP